MERYRRLRAKGRATVALRNGSPALILTKLDEFGDELPPEEIGVDVAELQAKLENLRDRIKDTQALLDDCIAIMPPKEITS